eukprot:scaffold253071_cov28-Tisochrysis_lutea.AAC.1
MPHSSCALPLTWQPVHPSCLFIHAVMLYCSDSVPVHPSCQFIHIVILCNKDSVPVHPSCQFINPAPLHLCSDTPCLVIRPACLSTHVPVHPSFGSAGPHGPRAEDPAPQDHDPPGTHTAGPGSAAALLFAAILTAAAATINEQPCARG